MEEEILDEYDEKVYYDNPNLVQRVKASLIDSVVIVILMCLAFMILDSIGVVSGKTRGIILGLIFLYEPIFVTINRTVGQKVMGLRVRKFNEFVDSDNLYNINIFSSMIRFVGKVTLGWISLLTIHTDDYGRAIHDKLGNSLMTKE